MYPAKEELLDFQVRLTLCAVVEPVPPVVVPVPDNAMFSGELPELFVNDAVAGADPALCGLNVSVKEAVVPAAKVNGNVIPLIVYSALFVPADEIMILEPLAVKVPVTVLVVPTAILPKFIDAGVDARLPGATAKPERAMETCGALLVTARVPVLLPLPCGVKVIVNV